MFWIPYTIKTAAMGTISRHVSKACVPLLRLIPHASNVHCLIEASAFALQKRNRSLHAIMPHMIVVMIKGPK